jgi:hypothetical protein
MRLLPKKRTQISGSVNVLGRDVMAWPSESATASVMYAGQIVEQGALRDIVRLSGLAQNAVMPPALRRASTSLLQSRTKTMDGGGKPGHDGM